LRVLTWCIVFYHLAYNINHTVGISPSRAPTDGMVADLVLAYTICADCWLGPETAGVPIDLVPSPYVTVCRCELTTCLVMTVELLGCCWVHARGT